MGEGQQWEREEEKVGRCLWGRYPYQPLEGVAFRRGGPLEEVEVSGIGVWQEQEREGKVKGVSGFM